MRKKQTVNNIIQAEANKIQTDILINLQRHSDAIEAVCKACTVRKDDCNEHFKKVDEQIAKAMELISGKDGLMVISANNTSNAKTLFWIVSLVFVLVATPDVVGLIKQVIHGFRVWITGV